MSGFNCCLLTCILVPQESGQVVWYSHLFKNFPQFVVIYRVKGFSIISDAEVDVFWNSLAFSMIQQMLSFWSLVPLPFLNPAFTSGSSQFTHRWSLAWSITYWNVKWTQLYKNLNILWHCPSLGLEWNRNFPVLWLLSFPNLLPYWVQHFKNISHLISCDVTEECITVKFIKLNT